MSGTKRRSDDGGRHGGPPSKRKKSMQRDKRQHHHHKSANNTEELPKPQQQPQVEPVDLEPHLQSDGEAYVHPSRRAKMPKPKSAPAQNNNAAPKAEVPKVEAPKVDTPKVETPAPATNGAASSAEAEAEDHVHPSRRVKVPKHHSKKSAPASEAKVEAEATPAAEAAPATAAEAEESSEPVEKAKKEKKEKKEKKDKKEKKEKKHKKKHAAEAEAVVEAPAETAEVPTEEKKHKKKHAAEAEAAEVPAEAPTEDVDVAMTDAPAVEEEAHHEKKAKKDKKEKKDKKSKKEKKEKKEAKAVEAAEEEAPEAAAAASADGSSYQQAASLTAVPEAEIEAFLKKEQVVVTDPRVKKGSSKKTTGVLRPILGFAHLPTTALTKQKPFASFSSPTPIQAASWPFGLAGRDVVGIAETGSGKTMAFALPCVEALAGGARPAAVAAKKLPSRSRLNNKWDAQGNVAQARAVVVSPTRELAMQTHAALAPLAARVGLTAVCLYGGSSKDDQRVLLRQKDGVDIIVATPGRLKDFLGDEEVSLAHVRFAVLDEADRMLDTGFEEDIRFILGACPDRAQRQTLMFTATWPTSVRGLAEGFMVDPVKITIGGRTHTDGDEEGGGSGRPVELQANMRIAQTVEVLEQPAKERRLLQIIKHEQRGKAKNDRILVFCLYKKEAVRVENFLQGQGVRVCSIHGNLRQEQRTRSLEAFKSGETPVLVATDVAARGLDIPEVKLVINVTFPLTIEDYVHRIGRTGRAGKDGRAITFFTDYDKTHSGELINVLKGADQPVPEDLLKFGTTVKKKAHGSYGAFFKDVDMSQKGTKITFD